MNPSPLPEEYNILHVGHEHLSPLDQKIIKEAQKGKWARMASFFVIGLMFFAMLIFNTTLQNSIKKNEAQIVALIDEVGGLSQANFQISQEVLSQEAVLQSIEGNFTDLGEALDEQDSEALETALANILGKLGSLNELDPSVEMAEAALSEVSEDSTFDILILGTNGAHTDTIMVASIQEEKEKITLFSIPRDLYMNGRRINEYYSYYGVDQLQRMVESAVGLQMDRYVEVDLQGFKEIIDILGGLDVYVEESIYDGLYPNGQGGYSAYSIEAGEYHMDGTEALKYARSRKSSSDFDRAERQQKILSALRAQLQELDSLMDMKEITELFQTGLTYTRTDMDVLDVLSYYYDYQNFEFSTGFVLSTSNYLYSTINQSGAYILLPKTGDFEEIQGVISELVN